MGIRLDISRLLFAVIMGVMMVGSITLINLLRNTSAACLQAGLIHSFLSAFLSTYVIAVPLIYVLAPLAQRLVYWLVRQNHR